MIVKLLTEHHLQLLSLNGGCKGSSESTLVKMSNCWKSHAAAHNVKMDMNRFCESFLTDSPFVKSVDHNWNSFKNSLTDSMKKHIPQKSSHLVGIFHGSINL